MLFVQRSHHLCVWTTFQTQAAWIPGPELLTTVIVHHLAYGIVIISLRGWNSH